MQDNSYSQSYESNDSVKRPYKRVLRQVFTIITLGQTTIDKGCFRKWDENRTCRQKNWSQSLNSEVSHQEVSNAAKNGGEKNHNFHVKYFLMTHLYKFQKHI